MTTEALPGLVDILQRRGHLDVETAARVAAAIMGAVSEFHRRQDTPAPRADARMLTATVEAIDHLVDLLERGDWPPAAVSHVRRSLDVMRAHARVRAMSTQPLATKRPGRPPDTSRRLLEIDVAHELMAVGITPTTTPTGVFSQVLEVVHTAIGLVEPDPQRAARNVVTHFRNLASVTKSSKKPPLSR